MCDLNLGSFFKYRTYFPPSSKPIYKSEQIQESPEVYHYPIQRLNEIKTYGQLSSSKGKWELHTQNACLDEPQSRQRTQRNERKGFCLPFRYRYRDYCYFVDLCQLLRRHLHTTIIAARVSTRSLGPPSIASEDGTTKATTSEWTVFLICDWWWRYNTDHKRSSSPPTWKYPSTQGNTIFRWDSYQREFDCSLWWHHGTILFWIGKRDRHRQSKRHRIFAILSCGRFNLHKTILPARKVPSLGAFLSNHVPTTLDQIFGPQWKLSIDGDWICK